MNSPSLPATFKKITATAVLTFLFIYSFSQPDFKNIEPCWSADGTKIVFASNRNGNADIYVMNANGTEQTNLTNHPGGDGEPQWSPDGSKILWISDRTGIERIFTMNTDGSDAMELTHTEVLELSPRWSPSGKRIAYASTLAKNTLVYIVNADGSRNEQATASASNLSFPIWSPDETKISCKSFGAGGFYSIIINVADHSNIRASKNTGWVDHHGWSADGTRSFFSSSVFNSSRKRISKIYCTDNTTGKTVTLAKNIEGLITVEIAPDGNRILYTTEKSVLVTDPAKKTPLKVGDNHHSAKWSPDGQSIVMVSSGTMNIFTVKPDGTSLTQLTR